jgi:hypothetical protein
MTVITKGENDKIDEISVKFPGKRSTVNVLRGGGGGGGSEGSVK